jgi:ATP-dependent DNA helicase PIF1
MDITLTQKQKDAYDAIVSRKNVFITGCGGTGKSLIIEMFKRNFSHKRKIGITSTTGISALLIGGKTLHSFLGIGLGNDSVKNIVESVFQKPWLKKRYVELETLIIDEVSMLSPSLFEKIEEVIRIVRSPPKNLLRKTTVVEEFDKKGEPVVNHFGGLQVVLVGDFLQLPVVKETNFCFSSPLWDKCIEKSVYLEEIIRQQDPIFQNVLNEIRYGNITEEVKKLLESRHNAVLKNDFGIIPTKICSTNYEVDLINVKELKKLNEPFIEYDMEIFSFKSKDRVQNIEKAKKNCTAPFTLNLCKNAQVMLLSNLDLDNGLANGSRGIVVDFLNDLPIVRFLNGIERIIDFHKWEFYEGEDLMMKVEQIPLKIAYAITVHKSQGSTLDYAEVDLANIFEYGQMYVALSRVKNSEGLTIKNIDFSGIKAHPSAIEFYLKLKN